MHRSKATSATLRTAAPVPLADVETAIVGDKTRTDHVKISDATKDALLEKAPNVKKTASSTERDDELIDVMVTEKVSIVKAPPRNLKVTVDTRYKQWTPVETRDFMMEVGGWCGLHADKFLAAAVSGQDLDKMTDPMLEGIGVTNGWQRYKILDALSAMKIEVEKKREENRKTNLMMKKKKGINYLDYNGDGENGGLLDAYLAMNDLRKSFTSFIFNKEVGALVVGVVCASRITGLIKILAEGVMIPLFFNSWIPENLENEFHVMRHGDNWKHNDTSTHYHTLADALQDGANVIQWGRLLMEVMEFFVLAWVIWLVYTTFNVAKRMARSLYLRTDKTFAEWSAKNGGSGQVIKKEHID